MYISNPSKIKQLQQLCKAAIHLTINDHKNCYMSVSDYLDDSPCTDELSEDVKAKMVELDTIVELQFYPNTPVGFLQLFHYDVDMALQVALENLKLIQDDTAE